MGVIHLLASISTLIAWMLAWIAYIFGCAAYTVSLLFDHEYWVRPWYLIYSFFLNISFEIQAWHEDSVGKQHQSWWPWGVDDA